MSPTVARRIREHVETFFKGHEVTRREFDGGPIQRVAPGFHVLAVGPGPRTSHWTYVSVGGVSVVKKARPSTEFLVISQDDRPELAERLAMTVHYHHTHTLGWGDTLSLGEPWLVGSTLDHALVARPYPYGPALEQIALGNTEHGHLLWVLPITSAERDFKKAHGLEALEKRFEQAKLRYWDVRRSSTV